MLRVFFFTVSFFPCLTLSFSNEAGIIFINFVKEHLGDEFESAEWQKWQEEMPHASKKWNKGEAKAFLNLLIEQIGVENTVKRLKAPSYFSYMQFEDFKERLDFFSEYIGEEGVKVRLKKSLAGFHAGRVEEMRQVVEFVKSYIGREGVKVRMEKDLQGFSLANFEELKEVAKYIESYIGKEGVKVRMEQGLQGFSRVNLEKLEGLERVWGPEKNERNP